MEIKSNMVVIDLNYYNSLRDYKIAMEKFENDNTITLHRHGTLGCLKITTKEESILAAKSINDSLLERIKELENALGDFQKMTVSDFRKYRHGSL